MTNKQINTIYFRIKGLKILCIKEYDRQIFLHKIISWILFSVSPAIGGILVSKKNNMNNIINIFISIILFLLPFLHYILSLVEHDKQAITLQIYISKIDSIMQLIEYHNTLSINDNHDFFVFINKQFNELESFKPFISNHIINNYLKDVCKTTKKEHIPIICINHIDKYNFVNETDIETGMLFELSNKNSDITTINKVNNVFTPQSNNRNKIISKLKVIQNI